MCSSLIHILIWVVWNPYTAAGSYQLERVKLKFFSFVGFSLGIPYEPHDYSLISETLGLHSLGCRRCMQTSKFFNNLLLNKIDSPTSLSLVNFKIPSHSTCSNITFHISRVTTNFQQYEWLRRLIASANNYHIFLDSYS